MMIWRWVQIVASSGNWGNEFGHQESVLLVDLCLLDTFVLCPTILEPDLDLCFREFQDFSELVTSSAGDVLVRQELVFQLNRLCPTKGGSLASWSSLFTSSASHCKKFLHWVQIDSITGGQEGVWNNRIELPNQNKKGTNRSQWIDERWVSIRKCCYWRR